MRFYTVCGAFVLQFAWLPFERRQHPVEPFLAGDGFDLYVDGCRFLPDSVTFTRVSPSVAHCLKTNIM
jgi:hypothetical protein